MPNYSKIEIENFNQKDKRISFLSIFSSLTQCPKIMDSSKDLETVVEKAFAITDELYGRYPLLVEGDEGMKVIETPA